MKNKNNEQDKRLLRKDATNLTLDNSWNIPVRFCANDRVIIEEDGVEELLSLLETQNTINRLKTETPDYFDADNEPAIREVVLTPDFHKGKGTPVGTVIATHGFVLPQVIGNDINCGMRLMTTSIRKEQLEGKLEILGKELRHVFFEGGRNLPMTPNQRQALLQYGIPGLIDTHKEANSAGLWEWFDQNGEESNLLKVNNGGSFSTDRIFALNDYIDKSRGLSHDSISGTLGGGNHFAELQYVNRIYDGNMAHACGISEGQVLVMIHTGSLGLGQVTGNYFGEILRTIYPETMKHPENGVYVLPTTGKHSKAYSSFMSSMSNAANFAFGNRMFIALMVMKALGSIAGDTEMNVIYDAPHNLIWKECLDGSEVFIHRKGATPAYGFKKMMGSPYEYYGEPVILPGSMGASSYLLRGTGNREYLYSASHGTGRKLSRGAAMKVSDEELNTFLKEFFVVTPTDFNGQIMKQRPDILKKIREGLKQEGPFAYKEIKPAVETLSDANVAKPVAELRPIMTVKG